MICQTSSVPAAPALLQEVHQSADLCARCRNQGSNSISIAADLPCVDHLLGTLLPHVDDEALLLEVADGHLGHGAIDAETLADDRRGDKLRLRDFLQQLVVRWLVEHHQVGELLLDLALAPLLLLALATGHGSFHLGLLRLLDHLVGAHGFNAETLLTALCCNLDQYA